MSDDGMSDDADYRYSPNVPEYWAYGCLDICYGRAECVPDNSRVNPLCGRVDPSVVFVCSACGKLFHADCLRLLQTDKARIKSFNRQQQRASGSSTASSIATCPSCIMLISSTWRTAQADTTSVVKIMRTAAATHGKPLLLREATELAASVTPALDASMLVRYSKLAHTTSPDESELQQLAQDLLHVRQPDQDLLNPDLAALAVSFRRKAEEPSPGRETATSSTQPPPTTARAGVQLFEAVMPRAKRSMPTQRGKPSKKARCAREGAGAAAMDAQDVAGASDDDDDDEADDDAEQKNTGACTVCGGGPSSGGFHAQNYQRHLAGNCHFKKMCKHLPVDKQPMDRRVFFNHRRVEYQLQLKQIRKPGRPSKKNKHGGLNAAFRAAGSISGADDDEEDDGSGADGGPEAPADSCVYCVDDSPDEPPDEPLQRCLGYDSQEVSAFTFALESPPPLVLRPCAADQLSICMNHRRCQMKAPST